MKDFDYQKTYDLCRKFHELGSIEVLVMDALFPYSSREITFTQLAKEIGKDTSNTRKAVLNLERMGIVCVGKHNGTSHMFIVDDWMNTLLNMKSVPKKHERSITK